MTAPLEGDRTMTKLAGRRILIVEDEALVAMLVEDALLDAGAEVIGPVATVAEAMALLDAGSPDGAVLDLNLAGETSTPVADLLAARGVPFVVATGYGAEGLPPGHAGGAGAGQALRSRRADRHPVADLPLTEAPRGATDLSRALLSHR